MFKSANPIVVSGRSTSTPRECSSIFASVRRSGFRGNPIWFHLFWCFQYLFFLFPFLFIFFFLRRFIIPQLTSQWKQMISLSLILTLSSTLQIFFLLDFMDTPTPMTHKPHSLMYSNPLTIFCPCFIKCSQLIYFIITTALHHSALHSALTFPQYNTN